jgi:hypothetical protein
MGTTYGGLVDHNHRTIEEARSVSSNAHHTIVAKCLPGEFPDQTRPTARLWGNKA